MSCSDPSIGSRQKSSGVSFGEFPDVLWSDVYLARPHECAISDKHLIKERLVFQSPPIGFVEIARTVENGLVAGVEYDIDLVTVQRLRGHYVMQRFHRTFSAEDQS